MVVCAWVFVQALPLFASEKGASVQELSLEDVIPTTVKSGMLSNGKLDFIVATVPETHTIEVCIHFEHRIYICMPCLVS